MHDTLKVTLGPNRWQTRIELNGEVLRCVKSLTIRADGSGDPSAVTLELMPEIVEVEGQPGAIEFRTAPIRWTPEAPQIG